MRKRNPDVRKYIRRIKQELPAMNREGKQMQRMLRQNVYAYAEEEPDVSYAQLVARFGSPEEIAAAYLSEQNSGTVKEAVRVRKKILTIVLAVAIFIVLLWSAYMVYVYKTIKEIAGGTIVVGEVIIEPSTMSESEYEMTKK